MIRAHLALIRRHRLAYLLLAAVWTVALVRVLVDPTPRLPILVNVTPSLPFTVVWIDYTARRFGRGDYVVYAFEGEAVRTNPGLYRQPLFKRIAGVSGDKVEVRDRHVYVNGHETGIAKAHSHDGLPLQAIAPTVIPPGYYYVAGVGPDSLDSRYAVAGLVAHRQIYGRAVPLL